MAYVEFSTNGPRNALIFNAAPAKFGCSAKGETMFQTVTKIVKWVSIPVLLIASLFACCAARYEPIIDCVMVLGAIVGILRAMWLREYYWAAGLLAIVAVFSPFSLAIKIFLLMGFTSIATFVTLLTAFRTAVDGRPMHAGILIARTQEEALD